MKNTVRFSKSSDVSKCLKAIFAGVVALQLLSSCTVGSSVKLKNAVTKAVLTVQGASAEKGSTIDFKVRLNAAASQAVNVNYSTGLGTASLGVHYLSVIGSLTFQPGEVEKTISVTTYANSYVCEPNRSFQLILSDPINATLEKTSVTGTITDSSKPSLTVSATPVNEGTQLVFTATLSDFCNSKDISFNYATSDVTASAPSRYTTTSGLLTIPAGQLSASVTVDTIDDGTYQGNQYFDLVLTNIKNATLSGSANIQGSILDTESVPTVQFASTTSSGLEDGGAKLINIILSNPTVYDVTIPFSITGGTAVLSTDYSFTDSSPIIIPAGSTSYDLTITPSSDGSSENDETVIFTMTAATNATTSGNTTHTFTVTNDDLSNITWIGGTSTNTATASNWSSNPSLPGPSDIVTFTSCSPNCPSLTASVDWGGVVINGAVTLTQGASNTINIRSGGWTQSAGTFTGSSGGASITMASAFSLSGGTFVSTNGTFLMNATVNNVTYWNVTAGTLTHNSGTIELRGDANSNNTYGITSIGTATNVNNLTLSSSGGSSNNSISWLLPSGKGYTTLGTFRMGRASGSAFLKANSGGANGYTIRGNLAIAAGANGGTSTLTFTNSGNVTYSFLGDGKAPKIAFQKAAGATITPASDGTSTIFVESLVIGGAAAYSLTFPSGDVRVKTETGASNAIAFSNTSAVLTNIPSVSFELDCNITATSVLDLNGSSRTFNNFSVLWSGTNCPATNRFRFGGTPGETAIVQGNLTIKGAYGGHNMIAGTSVNTPADQNFEVYGNVTLQNTGTSAQGTNAIVLKGGNTQTVSITYSGYLNGDWTINKSGGSVELGSTISYIANLTVTSGTLNLNGQGSVSTTGTTSVAAAGAIYIGRCNAGAQVGGAISNSGIISPIMGAMALNSNGTNKSSFVLPGDGFVSTSYQSLVSLNKIVVQPDDQILVGGEFHQFGGSSQNRLVRLNPDGTKDSSLSIGSGFNYAPNYVGLQSTGKILTGGSFGNFNGTSVKSFARLNSNGSYDSSLVESRTGNYFSYIWSQGILSLKSASFLDQIMLMDSVYAGLICGEDDCYDSYNPKPVRINGSNGSLDTSFNGLALVGSVTGSIEQADGKLIVYGNISSYGSDVVRYVFRLNTNGSLDTSFNVGNSFNSIPTTAAIQSDGKIIFGGNFTSFNGTAIKGMARLNADGSIDSSFNPGTGFNGSINAIKIQSDGKILVGGSFTSVNGTNRNRIARLNSNGSIDTGFVPSTSFSNNVLSIDTDSSNSTIYVGRTCNPY